MRIVSIDIGIVHMGIASAYIDDEGRLANLLRLCLVDLTKLRHKVVCRRDCKLYHSRELTDRLDHFYQEYHELFESADRILIERQPICGLQAVQQSLLKQFRPKITLIAPVQMHRHFNLNGSYNVRKLETVAIMMSVCKIVPSDVSEFASMDRLHDVADAVCLLMYYLAAVVGPEKVRQKETELTTRALDKNGIKGMFKRFEYRPRAC